MKNIPRRFIICCLMALTCSLLMAEEPRYNIVSREATAGMGSATSTNHVRQIVSREVTVGMGSATSTTHVRQIVSREVTVGVGAATSTTHVRNYFSREYTAGVGEETWRLLPESAYLAGMVELSLDAQFVQNPLQMTFNWMIRHNGATFASGVDDEWENFRYAWDTTDGEDGPYDVEMRFVRPNREDIVLTRRYYVLNTSGDSHFNETISGESTWKNDGKVHIIIGKTTVKNGGSLVIEPGAIVKFVNGASLVVEKGGSLDLSGVVLTHFADDAHGGDTNGDGAQSMPQYNQYSFTADAQAEVITDADTEFCYMSMTSSGKLTADALWPGNCLINVTNDLSVESGATLTILPGAIIKVAAGKSITIKVGGTLNAIGNRAQPIVFTSVKDDEHGGDTNGDGTATTAMPGDWGTILLKGGHGEFDYCSFIYGAGTAGNQYNASAIVFMWNNGSGSFKNCIFAHSLTDGCFAQQATFENCIFADCDRGLVSHDSTKQVNNCVFYDNAHGAVGHGGAMNIANSIFYKNSEADISDNGTTPNVRYSCVYSEKQGDIRSGYYKVNIGNGINGNITKDPLFSDAANGNFTLRANSPCIDAGDGSVANLPQYDYYGNPRSWSDGRVTPKGIADASGNYPDIGLFEMCGDMDSDLDVVMNWVEGPTTAMAGDTVTIRWQAANIGTVTGMGSRRDNIYLVSKDERLGNRCVFIATATVSGRLAPGGVVTYTFDKAQIPPVTPGKWGFAVFANEERDWFEGRNINNNYLVSAGDCEIALPTVACTGQGTTLTVNSGEAVGFLLTDVPAEGAMLVVRGDGMDVTGQFGYLPETIGQGWKAVNLGNSTVLLTIPPVVGNSDVFILLENSGNEDTQVELSALTGSFVLFDNGVTTATNSGTVTIPLYGIGLTADMDVYLKQGTARIDASLLTVAENGAVYATFDVAGAAVGSWTLFAANENGSGSLEALTLTQALKGPQWWCKLELPSAIRKSRECVGYLVYGNSGDCDLDAPYVKLEGKAGVSLRYDNHWGWGKTLNLLALSATWPVSKLSPGESRRIPFQFIYNNTDNIARISYGFTIHSDSPYPWYDITPQLRPSWADDTAWRKMDTILKSRLGNTWGTYLDRLRADADELAKNGVVTSHLDEIWQVEVNEAVAANYVMPTLESSMDIGLDARGLALYVTRSYNTSPMTRNTSGLFGNGWQTNLNLKGETNRQNTQMSFPLPDGDSLFATKTDDGYWAVQSPNGDIYCRQTAGDFILEKRNVWWMTYDSSLRLKTAEDINGNKVIYQWNGDLLVNMSHSDGQALAFVYQNNRLVKITDHHGRSVIYGYSSSNLVSVTDYNGLVTSYGYAQNGALSSTTSPDNQTTYYQYDAEVGRLASISKNDNQNVTQFVHLGMGRVEVINPYGSVTTWQFGTHGERLYTIDAMDNRTTYQYDDQNVLKSIVYANGQIVSYDMNSSDMTESTTDAAGHKTVKQYDSETGLLSRVTDVKGNLVSGFGYDDRYRMVTVEDAVGNCSVAEYDNEGNLVQKTNKNGRAISFEFDGKGRIIKKVWPDNSRVFTFEYDSYDNMTKATDSLLGDIVMAYDAKWNRLKRITYPDGRGYDVTYDGYGRKSKVRTFDGFEQNYIYDTYGYLAQITDEKGALLVGYEHDVIGFVTRRTYGNDTYTCYEYDANCRLNAIKHYDKTDALMERFEYEYDAVGRCVTRTQSTGTDYFAYNAAGELTRADYADGTYEAFTYDAIGNRLTSDVNGDIKHYTANSLNQYLRAGDAEFTYDDEGNMLSCMENGKTTHYEYDVENRLVKVTKPDGKVWSCVYNVFGDRVQTNDNGMVTNYLFNDDENSSVMVQYGSNGKASKRFILNGILAFGEMNASGAATYYHEDMGQNNRLFSNAQGRIAARQDYELFGQLQNESDMVVAHGFAGGIGHALDTTGLVHMRHRYYSPVWGRFIQNDPIGLAGEDVNFYRYCNNNPVMYVDANGNEMTWLDGVGFVGEFAGNFILYEIFAPSQEEHYNKRKILNKIERKDVIFALHGLDGWQRLSPRESACHDPNNNVKYVNKDGREIVIRKNKDGACIVNNDPKYMGTYNFGKDPVSIKHFRYDVLTWIRWGNAPYPIDPTTPKERRAMFESGKKLSDKVEPDLPCDPKKGVDLEDKTPVKTSEDPNEMVGPLGFGNEKTERFVTPGEWLSYTINFENKSSATAAAQEVFVDAQLSEHLDWSTFEIGSILFSNQTEMGLMGKQRGKILVDRQNTNQKVQIDVTMDASTGKVRWYLRSYDPNTTDHWPANVYDGFLPPNDDNHIGEGSLTYRIKVKEDAPHNARIDAAAEIIFDTNAMIPTDPAWFNTVYAMAPTDDFDPSLPDGTAMLQLDSLGWEAVPGAAEYDVTLWKVVDGKDVVVGSATGLKMGYWDISGYGASDAPGTRYHWQIVARNNLGSKTSGVYSFHTLSADEQMAYALRPGWNLVSVPFEIDAEAGGSELLDMSPVVYERLHGAYIRVAESMKAGTAAWLFSRETQSIRIWTDKGPQGEPKLPPELANGWNLTGICGTQELLLDCEAEGVSAIWTWNSGKFVSVPIENGAALLEPGVGYWIYLEK